MDKYKKIKIVGKGSFGFAVLVESRKSKKQFIIKIIDISKMEEKQIEEALTEVQVLKVMRYPYVVSYRQSFMEGMCLCIVMDYCEGGDLFNRIAKQKESGVLFSEQQILTWFVQMALALKHVHDRKILHRDLKTQNIFLTSKNEVKIGDFGIARVLQHTYDCANTAIGTPYYLSPEICQEKPYNQKSDIWSLGCILYELTTLNHAFDAQNMKGLVQKILKGTYPPIPQTYSNDLRKLISELLIKDPNKRPSIRKILEMPFLKARVNQLFSSTLQLHQSQLQKQGTSILELRNCNPTTDYRREEERKIQDYNRKAEELKRQEEMKRIQQSKKAEEEKQRNFKKNEKPKIQIISKNSPMMPTNNVVTSFSKRREESQGSHSNLKPEEASKSTYFNKHTPEKYAPSKENHNMGVVASRPQVSSKAAVMPDRKKQKEIDEEQTLEEQGYNQLLSEMKNFIHGSSEEEKDTAEVVHDNVVPKFLNLNVQGHKFAIPGMNERDTTGSKIEALRMYLEKEIGNDFIPAYKAMLNDKDQDFKHAKEILGTDKIKYIPLIVQLIVCQDSYY